MSDQNKSSILDQLRALIIDSVEIVSTQINLLQAKTAAYVLTVVMFVVLILIALLLGLAGFVLFNISIGFWLKNSLHSLSLTLTILGAFYALLAAVIGGFAIRWLKNLKS